MCAGIDNCWNNIIYKGSNLSNIIYDNLIIPLPVTILNIANSYTVILINSENWFIKYLYTYGTNLSLQIVTILEYHTMKEITSLPRS